MTNTKDQQVARVVQGLAAGVLAAEVEAVTSAKDVLESCFTIAWSSWAPAANFPSIAGPKAANNFWIGAGQSERRVGAGMFTAWELGKWWRPVLLQDGWELDEVLAELADDRASAEDWRELGRAFVAEFEPDELLRAS